MTSHEYYRALSAIDEALKHLREGYLDSDEKEGNALGGLLEPLGEIRGAVEAIQLRFARV